MTFKYTHLFIIDPVETLNPILDTSLRMAKALFQLGHQVNYCTPCDLSWESSKTRPEAYAKEITFDAGIGLKYTVAPGRAIDLDRFSGIHVRKDPPLDVGYFAITWFLDNLPESTKVYNQPKALREFNEKFCLLNFPEFAKPSLVSSNVSQILDYIKNDCRGDAVIKPLDLFGGKDVFRVSLDNQSEVHAQQFLQENLSKGGSRIIQTFDPAIFEGEIRVFTVFGSPLSWCLKIPQQGNFLANTGNGAVLAPYNPEPSVLKMVSKVSKILVSKGIFIVGFDIIGNSITEINVTSPRLLHPENNPEKPFEEFAELIQKDL